MLECKQNCLTCPNDKCLRDYFECDQCEELIEEMEESSILSVCWSCFDKMSEAEKKEYTEIVSN